MHRKLKKVYLQLTLLGNLVLLISFTAIAIIIQENHFVYSQDVRITRDYFMPLVASTVVLFFLSVSSVLWLTVSGKTLAFAESKVFIFLKDALKLTLIAFTLVAVVFPFMVPVQQTRSVLFLKK